MAGARIGAMEKEWDLRKRTMAFAVAVFRFCRALRRDDETWDVVRQLRRSASSVAANYRAVRRASSDAVFLAKTSTVIEEADEAGFWLEFMVEVEIVARSKAAPLLRESNELVAIFVASRKTTEARIAREAEEKAIRAAGGRQQRGNSSDCET